MWEIILSQAVQGLYYDAVEDNTHASLVIEYPNFYQMYQNYIKNKYGRDIKFVNLAANQEYLILTHDDFE